MPAIVVDVEDAFGNVITGENSTVTLTATAGAALVQTFSAGLVNGVATFNGIVLMNAGTYQVTATDTALGSGGSVTVGSVIMGPALTSVPKPTVTGGLTFGGSITLTTTLQSTAGPGVLWGGTATIRVGNTQVVTVLVGTNGLVQWTLTGVTTGSHACTVSYGGDSNHFGVSSAAFTITVTTAATTTKLVASASSVFSGQGVTLTATVNGPAGVTAARTGTVTFKDGATTIGTITLDGNSEAALTLTGPTTGTHIYTASYSGDTNFKKSGPAAAPVVVKKDNTTVELSSSAPGTVLPGMSFTLTATVVVNAPGSGTPTKTVTFKDGATVLGVVTVDGTGVAKLTTSFKTAGSHSITAVYSGDTQCNGSTSAKVVQGVDKAQTTVTEIGGTINVTHGHTVTVNGMVLRNAPAAGIPTGTVQILEGTKVLGTAVVKADGSVAWTGGSTLSLGGHTLVMSYLGDANDEGNQSGSFSVVVG
jgi:hypothetical protein